MLCMILVSCTGQKTGKENDNNDKIAIEVGENKFPPTRCSATKIILFIFVCSC